MSIRTFADLKSHIGHEIECVGYGATNEESVNAAIECITCGMVLIDLEEGQVVGVDDEPEKFNIGGLDVPVGVHALVKEFSQKRLKIQAIKAIRNYSGLGLVESKAIVDAYWAEKGFTYENKEESIDG